MTAARRATIVLLLLAFTIAGGGCFAAPRLRPEGPVRLSDGSRPDFGQFEDLPRIRVGCLPYPGLFTLFEVVGPDELGRHRYNGSGGGEADRGIVYTRHGGFIDLAHVRKGADLTAYFAPRFEVALREGWHCIQLRSREPSIYVVHLRRLDELAPSSPGDRDALARELSIRLAQRLAVQSLAWHEAITWHGYRAIILISEKPSAFTCDDMTSHALGAIAAGEALRRSTLGDDGPSYGARLTEALDRLMTELDPVDREQTTELLGSLEGHWWTTWGPTRRHFETGVDEPLVPWTVGEDVPRPLFLPALDDVLGHDCTGFARTEIEPRILEAGRIRSRLPGRPKRIDADRHLPLLLADARREWIEQAGPGTDAPCACKAPERNGCGG